MKKIFVYHGFSDEDAAQAADVLITADLRAIDSHGVARLSGYLRLIEKNRLNPTPNFEIERETATTATLNADRAVGLVAAPYAMKMAINKAETFGCGFVAINNSNHFGIAGYHAMMALEKNMIGFALTNASPLVTPALGAERMLGTNPIAVAIPAKSHAAFVLDMATSAASNGKLEIAERNNAMLKNGMLLDANGLNTSNPQDLKSGGMLLPLGSDMDHGSYKGYGLGAWVDIFSGVLSGANFGPWVPPFVAFLNPLENLPGKGIGHFVGAWKIDGFMDENVFLEKMDIWIERFKNTKKQNENSSVMIPGEPELEAQKYRIVHGIPLNEKVQNDLVQIGINCNIPFLN